jgi:hypothetical protein
VQRKHQLSTLLLGVIVTPRGLTITPITLTQQLLLLLPPLLVVVMV